jgi:hypothetical protein
MQGGSGRIRLSLTKIPLKEIPHQRNRAQPPMSPFPDDRVDQRTQNTKYSNSKHTLVRLDGKNRGESIHSILFDSMVRHGKDKKRRAGRTGRTSLKVSKRPRCSSKFIVSECHVLTNSWFPRIATTDDGIQSQPLPMDSLRLNGTRPSHQLSTCATWDSFRTPDKKM